MAETALSLLRELTQNVTHSTPELAQRIVQAAALAMQEAHGVEDVSKIRNRLRTIEDYVKCERADKHSGNMIAAQRLRTERQIGDLLADPSRPPLGSHERKLPGGVSWDESSQWQRIAKIERPTFDGYLQTCLTKNEEISTIGLLRLAKSEAREGHVTEPLPEGCFSVLYADPPWQYDFSLTGNRDIENQYPSLDVEEIKALDVVSIVNEAATLFLWATSPKLPLGLEVMKAWGFEYKTCAVWDKEIIGMGYYFRQQHELLLVGTVGKAPVPDEALRPASVIRERRGKHSEKPELVYELIEHMYPGRPKIELFARNEREGWVSWGNEVVEAN